MGLVDLLKRELNTSKLESHGSGGGGCISSGQGYVTDSGIVFVKMNNKSGSREMFDGEYASLDAMYKTCTLRVPKPIKVFDNPEGGAVLVTEYLDMRGLRKHQRALGENLAKMHQHNALLKSAAECKSSTVGASKDSEAFVDKFGFHIPTACGFILQQNTWEDDWPTFYIRHKLQIQLDLIEKEYHDSDARTLWGKLQHKIPKFFDGLDIVPALVHGDLWSGNAAEMADGSGPVTFDPASCYAHGEFDLGIATMFGGFSSEFYKGYHSILPKQPGYEKRIQLYQLFHYLNHWNHFGTGYRGQSISIMRALC